MTPSPADPSPLDTLRQLKVLLDQGAITPAEYDTLKQRLLTAPAPPADASANPVVSSPEAASFPPAVPEPAPQPAPPAPTGELPSLLEMFQQTPAGPPASAPMPPAQPSPAPRPEPPKLVPVTPVVVARPEAETPEVEFLPRSSGQSEMRPLTEFLPPASAAATAGTPPASSATGYSAPTPSYPPPIPPPAPTPTPTYPSPAASPYQPAVTPVMPPVSAAHASNDSEWLTSPAPDENVTREPEEFVAAPEPSRPANSALPKVLLVLGGLALLLVLGYLFMGRKQSDEHLTSLSKTAADSVAVRPDTGPQAEQLNLPPATEAEVERTVPARPALTPIDSTTAAPAAPKKSTFPAGEAGDAAEAPATATPATTPAAATPAARSADPPAAAEPVPAAAPEDGDDEATTQVRQALASYYADLQAPPVNASQHFAPVVERLYNNQNLTPAAVEADMAKNLFPDFKQISSSVVPGTLRVGPPAADGTRTATYTELRRAFRVSRGQHQRTRTKVRVRFNADYKMTYMRQESQVENTFEQ